MHGKTLDTLLTALRGLGGGYFVLRAEDGEAFVVMPKSEFDRLDKQAGSHEVQLTLPADAGMAGGAVRSTQREADEVLERINREIALYQAGKEQDDALEDELIKSPAVRFEPLRGDLPPELQE
ncbi:MAG: hypothetical protein HY372_00855 [Candidatus Andersenbacteria bacterium]|nr:hypothetical protein [Candidatus Andersenbacteria bacterium]